MFIKFDHKVHDHVIHEENNKGKILGEYASENLFTIVIDGVLLVKGLKHKALVNYLERGIQLTLKP